MKCNHPCSYYINGQCMREHNYECPALQKPTDDVIEFVRCRGCKDYKRNGGDCDLAPSPDWFCTDVKPKEKADAEEWDAYNTTYRPYARWAKDGQFIDCTLDPAYSPCEYPKCRTCPMRVESNLLKKLKILEEKVAELEEKER